VASDVTADLDLGQFVTLAEDLKRLRL